LGIQTLLILQHDEVVIVEPNNTKQLGKVDNVDVNEGLKIIIKQFKAMLGVQGRNDIMVAQIIELQKERDVWQSGDETKDKRYGINNREIQRPKDKNMELHNMIIEIDYQGEELRSAIGIKKKLVGE
jgi:hypothetical protein